MGGRGAHRVACTTSPGASTRICHQWGAHPFETADRSGNVSLLSVVSLGESWHNSHHAFPALARHGCERGQLDSTAALLRILVRLGWASNPRWPRPEQVALVPGASVAGDPRDPGPLLVSKPRSTYGKRQREQEKREKAQAKVERKVARQTTDPDEPDQEPVEASESELIEALAGLHGAYEAGDVALDDFEERRDHIRAQLERIQQ